MKISKGIEKKTISSLNKLSSTDEIVEDFPCHWIATGGKYDY